MFEFEYQNGTAILIRYFGRKSHVVVPEFADGHIPVTTIGENAFSASNAEVVLLPKSVTIIEDRAFFRCPLRWIGCGSDVEDRGNDISCIHVSTIGKGAFQGTFLRDLVLKPTGHDELIVGEKAFAGTTQLRNVVFGDGPKTILGAASFYQSNIETCVLPTRTGKLETIPEDCYFRCVYLRSIRFRTKKICSRAFLACEELRSIPLEEGVEEICDSAFKGCALQQVSLPASCVRLAPNAFENTSSVEKFHVASQNQCFCSEDGVLYNKDKTKLISFPSARSGSFVLPKSVTVIGKHAFCNSRIMEIVLSENLKTIEEAAFEGAICLTEIAFPDSLEYIGEGAFSHCKLYSVSLPAIKIDWEDSFYGLCLKEIHFRGSQEEYNLMVSGELIREPVLFLLDASGREYRNIQIRKRTLQFEYSVLSGGEIRIDRVLPTFGKIVIPETIDNMPVVEIGPGAFPFGCEEIFVPCTVGAASESMSCCRFLHKLTIPDGLWIEPAHIPRCEIMKY